MGVKRGLSIDGVVNLANVISDPNSVPNWMRFGATLGQLTGSYKVLNFMTGMMGLDGFMFQGQSWTIGGMAFDGIMRTDHESKVRTTNYPVQTGVTMTDHAIIEPAELTIDIMMSDAATENLVNESMTDSFLVGGVTSILGKKAGKLAKTYVKVKNTVKTIEKIGKIAENFQTMSKQKTGLDAILGALTESGLISTPGGGRSRAAWQTLKEMQMQREPLTVVTRLQTYENMIIEELSAPDDYMTLNALKCTVHLRQIIFANVATTKTSARAASTNSATKGGQVPGKTDGNKTALRAMGAGG
jgi:hypothetical protein